MSFASSSALKAGREVVVGPLEVLGSEGSREDLLEEEVGLGSQRRL